MPNKLTILIPVFNEEGNLLRVEKELSNFIESAKISSSVLFINDGSTDKSQQLINDICARQPRFNSISLDKNRGLSTALKAGIDFVNTEYVGYIDADLQTSPQDFNLLIPYIKNYALVTGIRSNRKDKFLKKMSSKIANSIRKLFTNDGVLDTGCPLKIMQTSYAKQIPMFKGLHRFLPAMIQLQNGKVKQVAVRHFPRMHGKGNFGFWNRSIGPLTDCFAFLWMRRKYINYEIKYSSKPE
ncbi:glycosyltransferase [Winogradskyella litorisediminis]|uniref:Glycosyltransferase n=1 Tax=Winogradskyella litorisediminis TaxID=1156618 RepID=A0ABW3NCS5_9FLAO